MSDPSGEARVPSQARPPTVLVVEDEILVRMLITDSLRDAGFTVVEADNADEALSVLRGSCPVDVVVSDVRMPGTIDGIALAQLVRSEWPATKIILASGNLSTADSMSHDGVFSKPFDLDRLIVHIRMLTR